MKFKKKDFLFLLLFTFLVFNFFCKKIPVLDDKRLGPVYSLFISGGNYLNEKCIINPTPLSLEAKLFYLKNFSTKKIKFKEVENGFILKLDDYFLKAELKFDLTNHEESQKKWTKDELPISCKFDDVMPDKYHIYPYLNISVPMIDSTNRYAIVILDVPERGGGIQIFELRYGIWTQMFISLGSWIY